MGYTSRKQDDKLPVEVGGIGTSGLQETNKDINTEVFPFSSSMTPNNGDNPSMSESVEGPCGEDKRNKSGGSVTNESPSMPGA